MLSPYGFPVHPQQLARRVGDSGGGVNSAYGSAMSLAKRRRLDLPHPDAGGEAATVWDEQQHQQHPSIDALQAYAAASSSSSSCSCSFNNQNHSHNHSHSNSHGHSHSHNHYQSSSSSSSSRPNAALNDSDLPDVRASPAGIAESAQQAQWGPGTTSPYPDVASYQQPYFFQHTDPSIYTSPWPPPPLAYAVAGPSAAESLIQQQQQQQQVMPFFPPSSHQGPEGSSSPLPGERFDAAALSNYPDPDVGVAGPPYASAAAAQPAMAREIDGMRPPPPPEQAFMLEDASMHLKIQSLSILENLVR